jgi:hypothetical protein
MVLESVIKHLIGECRDDVSTDMVQVQWCVHQTST